MSTAIFTVRLEVEVYTMMGRRNNDERSQIQMLSIDDLVPQDHLIRKIDAAIDLSFIYDKLKDLYKPDGRESIDSSCTYKNCYDSIHIRH